VDVIGHMSNLVGVFETRECRRARYASRPECFTNEAQLADVPAPVADLPGQQSFLRGGAHYFGSTFGWLSGTAVARRAES
jgi:hypothetical protein